MKESDPSGKEYDANDKDCTEVLAREDPNDADHQRYTYGLAFVLHADTRPSLCGPFPLRAHVWRHIRIS